MKLTVIFLTTGVICEELNRNFEDIYYEQSLEDLTEFGRKRKKNKNQAIDKGSKYLRND